ncbi:MAG: dihydroorotase family protein, partial [Candidatus Micrarchaeota archaeon]
MIIKNGKIVTSRGAARADILIENGKIKKIARAISGDNDEIFDARGLHIFPGLVDAHVHFRDPGATHKEDFYTGTAAALAGGVTTIIDMPNYHPPTTNLRNYNEKRKIAREKAVCDYSLRFGASESNFDEVEKAHPRSLKIFTCETGSELRILALKNILAHFRNFDARKPICIHCEDQHLMDVLARKHTADSVEMHNRIRSPLCAALALSKILFLAHRAPRKIHICHVSTGGELALLRSRGKNVTCEVTPHHLFLSEEDLKKLGNFGKTNPPLRAKKDQAALWHHLHMIDIVASDHAPHTREEKEKNYRAAPSGVPGVETTLPLLLDAANKKRMTLARIVQMTSSNPARIFNLKSKGALAAGKDADLVLVDLKKSR